MSSYGLNIGKRYNFVEERWVAYREPISRHLSTLHEWSKESDDLSNRTGSRLLRGQEQYRGTSLPSKVVNAE